MKFTPHKVRQILHDECVRCSVASLFSLPREDVPHFFREEGGWSTSLRRWCDARGLRYEVWHHTLRPINEETGEPLEWYLGYGDSGGDPKLGHCVVVRNGEIWHDPSGCGVSKWNAWVTFREK
jgi:hypothetical protein